MNPYFVKLVENFTANPIIQHIKRTLEEISKEMQGCAVYTPLQSANKWNTFITKTCLPIHTLHTTHTTHYSTQTIQEEEEEYTESEKIIFEKIDQTGIFGRNLELFFPLLSVAQAIGSEVFEDILNVVSNLNKNKKEDEFAESKDISLIEFVSLADRHRFAYARSIDLFREFKEFIGNQGTDDESKWLNVTWFGSALKRLKLIHNKKREASGQFILLNVDKAKEKIKIFKTSDEIEKDTEEREGGGK
jgi:hypothetical protein